MENLDPNDHAQALAETFQWHEIMLPAFIELGDKLGGKIHLDVYADFPGAIIPALAKRQTNKVDFPDAAETKDVVTVKLNIRSGAVENRALVADAEGRIGISFTARFNGVKHPVFVPAAAIANMYYPDTYCPPVRIPSAPVIDWLFVQQIYGKVKAPAPVVVEQAAGESNVRQIGSAPRGRPTLTVVK